jgi:hypothetical protein
MTWQTNLVRRYPHLFRSETPEAAPGYPRVGEGWRSIIKKAVERIDDAVGGLVKDSKAVVRIAEIKQKHGGLRIDMDWTALPAEIEEKVREAIDLAEARADSTCEICGDLGRLYDLNNWLLTRCELHAEGKLVPQHRDTDLQVQYEIVDGTLRAVSSRLYDRELDAFVNGPLPFDEDPTEEK